MSRVLIAEDEPRIASFAEKGLKANGFTVTVVRDGSSARDAARSGEHDLMVLDIGLPVLDGFAVLAALRAERCTIPVIVLTARDSVTDTVAGLEGGADDYMPKPFRFEELLVRLRLRLAPDRQAGELTVLTAGDLSLDLRTRRADVGGRLVDLSAREFALTETFLRHPGQVLAREQLLSHVWGYDVDPGSNVVDVYVRYLRKKLGADRIETVRGMGHASPSDPSSSRHPRGRGSPAPPSQARHGVLGFPCLRSRVGRLDVASTPPECSVLSAPCCCPTATSPPRSPRAGWASSPTTPG